MSFPSSGSGVAVLCRYFLLETCLRRALVSVSGESSTASHFPVRPKYVMVWLRIGFTLRFPLPFPCWTWKGPPSWSGTLAFWRGTVTAPWSHPSEDSLEVILLPLQTSALSVGTRHHGTAFASGSRPIRASALIREIIDALITKARSLRCQE